MSTEQAAVHPWTPVEPLTQAEGAIDVAEFSSLSRVWEESRRELEENNEVAFAEFLEKLRRSWSVETGILENLYILDRGTTQTLIDRGFYQELVNAAATDIEPTRLVEILKDHLLASELVQDFITGDRPLTPHLIRELHSAITRHQESVEAVDTLGRITEVPIRRGQWKDQPNGTNVGGIWHPFCPPEQVPGQVEELLEYLRIQESDGTNVCVLAAWFHYWFTSIHPFQDGNGRVARALVNYLFIKSGLFPVVIDRDQKVPYIDALEAAEAGRLEDLVRLFSDKQIEAIKRALSLQVPEEEPRGPTILKELARGFLHRQERRREQERQQLRGVNGVLADLWTEAEQVVSQQLHEFEAELESGHFPTRVVLATGGPEQGTDYYYKGEIIEDVNSRGQWANFNEEARWVRALVWKGVAQDPVSGQLRFVVSFHHIGRDLSGVAEVTCFARLEERFTPENQSGAPQRAHVDCMIKPFSVTWQDDFEALRNRFRDWLGECLVIALRSWLDTL